MNKINFAINENKSFINDLISANERLKHQVLLNEHKIENLLIENNNLKKMENR